MRGKNERTVGGAALLRARSLLGVAALVLGLGFALTACGGSDDSSSGGEPSDADLVIGASVPLSGGLESVGPAGQKAAELAVTQIENAITAAGSDETIDLRVVDNETDPVVAVDAANELKDAGASCITGAWASVDTISTANEVSIPSGILQVSPASSSDAITSIDDNGLLNRTVLPDSAQGAALADGVALDLGGAEGNVVNIGARKDAYGAGIADSFTKEWTGLGGTIGERVDYDVGLPSYDKEADQMTSGSPDAVLIADRSDNFPALATALEATGAWDPGTAWGPDGLAASALLDDPGAKAVTGLRATAPGTPSQAPETKAFDQLYASSDPTDVTSQRFDAQTFDAVILCYLASVAADSTDGADMAAALEDITGPGGQKYTWEQLPAAVEALNGGKDIDYVGASGPLDLDADGDPTAGAYDLYEFGKELKLVGNIPVPAQG